MEKRRHDFKKNSLLAYMVSFGIVVTAIIIAMGVYLYWFYYNKIEADFLRENDTYVSTICDIHEREIGTLDTISVEMYLSRNTVEFKLAENPLKNLTLKEQLFRYQSVNTFFSNLFCIYHEEHYLFNSTTSVETDHFLQEGIVLKDTEPEELRRLMYSSERGMKVLYIRRLTGTLRN